MNSVTIVPVIGDMHYSHVAYARDADGVNHFTYGHSFLEAFSRFMYLFGKP